MSQKHWECQKCLNIHDVDKRPRVCGWKIYDPDNKTTITCDGTDFKSVKKIGR